MTDRDFAFVLIGGVFALASACGLRLTVPALLRVVRRVIDGDFKSFDRGGNR